MTFGEKVQQHLEFQGITQSQLAEKMGVSRQSIFAAMQQLKPQARTVLRYAKALGVSPYDLETDSADTEKDDSAKPFPERIKAIMKHYNLSHEAFAKRAGIASSVILGYEEKKSASASANIMGRIIVAFPEINGHWLITGQGNMLSDLPEKEDKSSSKKSILQSIHNTKIEYNARAIPMPQEGEKLEIIKREDGTEFRHLGEDRYFMITPLVTQYAYAGYQSGWADSEYIEELPRHAIVVDKLHFGIYRSFTVKGDSMDNGKRGSYQDGDIVTARRIHKNYWRSRLHLHDFQDYVIHTHDGIIIKRIKDHDVENGVITYESLNPNKDAYPDKTLSLGEVVELYNVVTNTHHF